MQRLLFAVSAMVLVYTVSQNLWFQAPVNIATIKPKFPLRHCWVLTLNTSLQPHTIAPDLTCQPFLAQQFNAEQFAMLSPLARDKLIHPEKQTMASDLTNNNSVSIFANHVRMWKAAAALPEPILILEDDAVLHTNAGHTLQIIMHELINVRLMRNLVLKLSSTTPSFLGIHNPIITHLAFNEWKLLMHTKKQWLYECMCRTWWQTSGLIAYVITPQAAHNLVRHHMPVTEHVDVFIHKQGCIAKNIQFILAYPGLARQSGRPSTHQHEANWLNRKVLLFRELQHNIKSDSCK